MPTLGEACHLLRISRRTLDKWLERLAITPTRHAWDYRYYEITTDELETIADARRKLPTVARTGAFIPSSSLPAFDRRSPREATSTIANDRTSPLAPTARARPLQRDGFTELPDGMMSRTDVADRHGFPRSTLRRWCDEGRVETSAETYGGVAGQFAIHAPVTARGLRQFYRLASHRADFVRCADCPHAEAEPDSGIE